MALMTKQRTVQVPEEIVAAGVGTTAQLHASGLTAAMISNRCRSGGPWRRLLPGVVQLDSDPPNREQRVRAALLYAGDGAALTGVDALTAAGVAVPVGGPVRVLIAAHQRRPSRDFVAVERTARMPRTWRCDGFSVAPPARAALDAARAASDPTLLTRLLVLPVLHGACGVGDLVREVERGNQRGTSFVRRALREFDARMATVRHATAAEIVAAAPLPAPRWNATVRDRAGRVIGYADACWDGASLVWLIEPPDVRVAHHARRLTDAGFTVVTTPIADVLAAAADEVRRAAVLRELSAAFLRAARGGRARVRGVDAAA